MSTSPNAVSAFMLSLSEFACLVSEQHYRFLSQSLNNLEHQIEQHRVERYCYDFSYFVLFTYVFSLFLEVSHGTAALSHFF